MKHKTSILKRSRRGAALLVALWMLIILSLIVGSFAFEAQLESMLVSHKRKRFQSEMLAASGVEYARAIIDRSTGIKESQVENQAEDKDGFMMAALHIKRGLVTTSEIDLGYGSFSVTLESAEGNININVLNREDWIDIFEMANVPSTEWDAMIDCLDDWIDRNDLHGLNGAESDDPFYEERGYPVKNGPLDSVEELLLIKNWGPDILYGKEADEESDEIIGIGELVTVWGNGQLNLNTASVDAMFAAGLSENEILDILEARKGPDGIEGTADDGLPPDYIGNDSRFKLQTQFVKVTSIGKISNEKYQIECILLLLGKKSLVVFWNEGPA